MAKLSRIEQLKAKLGQEKEKKERGGSSFNSDIYPFWQMAVGDSAKVRILADKNEDNDYVFFVDRLEHKISINGEDKRIPCRQMYGEECPICDLSRKYYKEEGKGSKNGKYYYRNKTSLVRVLVVEDPLDPNKDTGEKYEGKVLNTQFGYQLMEKIKEQISNDDLGDFTDLEDGYDFIIKKTPQGDYGTYSVGSGFARRPSAIDEDIRDSVELIDLSTLLPKDFGLEKVTNMLHAHITGEDYEDDSDTKSTKAQTKTTKTEVTKSEKKQSRTEEVDADEEEVSEKETTRTTRTTVKEEVVKDDDDADDDGDDIIARLRARRQAAKK